MENFIVSARKYRPATFISVVGQGHITATLKNAISRNQLAHAYLFCGPRGVGKTTCARIFAKAINCQNPQDSEACNECESCRNFNEGRSFNIHELDAASNNSVDDIRSLTEQVRIPPQIGKYSVYIIDEVHMLSQAAFNAFLKTLEEPPAHAIFILATTEKHKIIPTILSRCQIYDFNRIRVEDSVSYLKYIAGEEGVAYDDESLNLIAQKADGGMRDALSMFDKAIAFCGTNLDFKEVARTLNVLDYDTYFTITDTIKAGDYKQALITFDEVLRKGFSGQTFIAGLSNHFRDLLMCKDTNTSALLDVTGSLLDKYRKQSAESDIGFLFNAIALLSTIDNTFKTATNQRLHVELGLMKLCGLGQKKNDLEPETPTLPPLQRGGEPASASNPATSQQGSQADRQATSQYTSSSPANSPQQSAVNSGASQQIAGNAVKPEQTSGINSHNTTGLQSAGQATDITSASDIDWKPVLNQENNTQENFAHPYQEHRNQGAGIASDAITATQGFDQTTGVNNAAAQASVANMTSATSAIDSAPKKEPANGRRGISGVSLSDILNSNSTQANEDTTTVSRIEKIDPESESKILAAKDEFVETLNRNRPRFATAFSSMAVTGNRISISVSSELLKEDIVQSQKEISSLLIRIGAIDGNIELNISVSEEQSAVKPIKPEDKLEHLRKRNPALDLLRKELDLEIE